jgi:PhnB protein
LNGEKGEKGESDHTTTIIETSYSMTKLNSYLLFDGTCKDAMEFYKSLLGGELVFTTVGDSPMAKMLPPVLHARVVNASLQSDSGEIYASDWLAQDETPTRGNMNCLYLNGGSRKELDTLFGKLSEGADVTNPLQELPFGHYGRLFDKFGVIWMFHTDRK